MYRYHFETLLWIFFLDLYPEVELLHQMVILLFFLIWENKLFFIVAAWFCELSYYSLDYVFWWTQVFRFGVVQLFYYCIYSLPNGCCIKEIIKKSNVVKFFPMFSSKSFIFLALILKSITHFKLTFCILCKVRLEGFFLGGGHVTIQLFLYCLLKKIKMMSFPHWTP